MKKQAPKDKKALTTGQVVIRIMAIVSSVEFLIMLFLNAIPQKLDVYTEATLDLILLALLSTPLIYALVIKPFATACDNTLVQISLLAHTDALTQLPNRRALFMHLEKHLASSARHKVRSALLLIDLNKFKSINDVHGHDAGDTVLVETAKRLQSNTRSEDVISRLGGDEFVILIQHLDADEEIARSTTGQLAKKLADAINKPIKFYDATLKVSASIGIRLLDFEEKDARSVLREADTAMYHAKQSGKGRTVFFENNSPHTHIPE